MQYEFLKQFSKRMKHVGMYALLLQNSLAKQTWKQYGFMKTDEQINMIFAVMLYIMEQSLREESCTMDDIGAYIDNLNTNYFQKNMSYDDCKKLGDFIVNIVLSNEGRAMYFDGYDFEVIADDYAYICSYEVEGGRYCFWVTSAEYGSRVESVLLIDMQNGYTETEIKAVE